MIGKLTEQQIEELLKDNETIILGNKLLTLSKNLSRRS